jgi:hypothetical protein
MKNRKEFKRIIIICAAACLLVLFWSLTAWRNKEISGISSTNKEPNYSETYYWASIPDSLEKQVDVFFVYPTLFGNTGVLNMDITDNTMRSLVQAVLLKQAAVFKNDCNIYAPYYRQMAMDGLTMDSVEQDKYFSIGLADVENAFDYYIDNLNNGRPFILAGHSQGSMVLIQLMKDKFENAELMKKLVAAYIIGYSVTDSDLNQYNYMKIAESNDDIGVIITYNTQSEFSTGSPVLLPNANCVNPLNWKSTTEYAPKEMNLGAVFFNNNGDIDSIVPQYTDAWIDVNNALVVGSPNSYSIDVGSFPKGVYHMYDYSFFFNNLIENVGVRISMYKQKME